MGNNGIDSNGGKYLGMMIKEYDAVQYGDLREVWNKLSLGKDMTVFQSFWWNGLLLQEIKKIHRVNNAHIVVGYIDDIPALIAPIYVIKYGRKIGSYGDAPGVYLWGWDSISDYCNLIYDNFNEKLFEELRKYINEKYMFPFYINRVLEKTQLSDYLRERYSAISSEIAVWMNVPDDMSDYHVALSKHVRQNLRTARNRIVKSGLNMEIVCGMNELDEQTIQDMEHIYVDRQKQKFVDNSQGIRKMKFRLSQWCRVQRNQKYDIVSEALREKHGWSILVKIDDQIAAFANGLIWQGVVYFVRVSYDMKYAFYSPMYQGIYEAVKQLVGKDAVRILDFTRGDEKYKLDLISSSGQLENLYSYRIVK